jgi:hypothetical protein
MPSIYTRAEDLHSQFRILSESHVLKQHRKGAASVKHLLVRTHIIYEYVRFEAFTAVTMKMVYSGMLRYVALVRTDVSDELSASFIRVIRIGELGTTLAVKSNRCTL